MSDLYQICKLIKHLHYRICDKVVGAFDNNPTENMAAVVRDDEGDTIFAIDVISEEVLLDFF